MADVPQLTATTRWRCSACGNLTRFDVLRSSRMWEFVHVDLSGEPAVDEREVLEDRVEEVRCRWCGAANSVVLVDRPASEAEPTEAPGQVERG